MSPTGRSDKRSPAGELDGHHEPAPPVPALRALPAATQTTHPTTSSPVVTVQIAVCARWLGLFWPEHEIVELEGVWRYGEVVMVVPGTVYVFNVEEARPPGTRGAAVVRRPFPRVETVR